MGRRAGQDAARVRLSHRPRRPPSPLSSRSPALPPSPLLSPSPHRHRLPTVPRPAVPFLHPSSWRPRAVRPRVEQNQLQSQPCRSGPPLRSIQAGLCLHSLDTGRRCPAARSPSDGSALTQPRVSFVSQVEVGAVGPAGYGLWPKGQPARHPGPPSSFCPRSSLPHTSRASTAYSCSHPYSCMTCSCMETAISFSLVPHDVHMSAPPQPALLKVTSRCRPTQPSTSRSSTADGCHRPPRRRPRRRLCATVANGERLRLRRRVFRGCIGNCGGRLRPSRGRRRDDLQAACVSNAARAAQS